MDEHELVLRLSGTGVPDGQLSFTAVGRLADALQELTVRVGRWSADQHGPGRSLAAVEAATQLRLTAVGGGSTTLHAVQGAYDVLPIDDGLEGDVRARVAEVLEAIPGGAAPAWAPVGVKESVVRVIEAFGYAAERVELTLPGRAPVHFAPAAVSRAPWSTRDEVSEVQVEMIGRVEAVDLRTSRFRLRDAVGNAIALHRVVDAERVAALVGREAMATGKAIVGDRGQVVGVDRPALAAAPSLPESWTQPARADHDAILAAAPGPDPDGGVELTDEEYDAFMSFLKH